MNIQPYYPSKYLIIDSSLKISGSNVNFKVEIDSDLPASEGNYYIRLIDIQIEQLDKPGVPYSMKGMVLIKSDLSKGNSVFGCKFDGKNTGLSNVIGFSTNKSNRINLDYLGDLTNDQKIYDFGSITSVSHETWIPIKSPNGICSFELVDTNGVPWAVSYSEDAITNLGNNSNYVDAFTEEIGYVNMIFEIKQVKPLDEAKAQLKVARPYLPI